MLIIYILSEYTKTFALPGSRHVNVCHELCISRVSCSKRIFYMCRWTQWIFIQLFNKGLAYQAEVPVNWCPALGTVLANEEIIDGKSERGDHPVVRMPMKQVPLHNASFMQCT